MKKGYNLFRRFCAFVLGAVFLFSGTLKLIDPVGSGFVMSSYFSFLHIGFMDFSAKFFAVAFALTEAVLGVALMSGVWRKAVGTAVICLTVFFTLLTAALVVFNPPMDCGCFGEAVHLTHFQTFVKNVALCALCCGAFIPLRNLDRPVKVKYASFAISAALLLSLTVYSLIDLPLKDYTAFRAGTVIGTSGAGQLEGEMPEPEFIYEKDGLRRPFTLDNLPDSSWTFVDSRISHRNFDTGAVLSLTDISGEYCDSVVTEGNVLVVSAYGKVDGRRSEGIRELVGEAAALGLRPVVILPSAECLPFGGPEASLPEWTEGSVFFADHKTIATLNRSNGGVTYISDGQIVRKWSFALRPSEEELSRVVSEDPTSLALETQSHGSLAVQGFFLCIFAVLLLL